MSIVARSSRVLKLRKGILGFRYASQRPELRFKNNSDSLVGNYDNYGEIPNDQPIGALGYFLLTIPAITFGLGTWQVQRRKWKLGLIDDLNKRVSSEPIPLPTDLNELVQLEYCPIKVKGKFLYDKEFTVGPKSLIKDGAGASEQGGGVFSASGNTGYCLITPFKVEGRDTTILINRGWVKARPAKLPKQQLGHVPGTMEVIGIVRLHERRQAFMPKNKPNDGVWFNRDLLAMADKADADPVFLDLIASSGVPGGPIAGQTRITLRNEHLTYVLTWYSLSIITGWMWHRLYIKKLPLL